MAMIVSGARWALRRERWCARAGVTRALGPLLVIGALALSACGGLPANSNGGTHQLGAQDQVGSVTAGGCIDTGPLSGLTAHTYYCGQYARQWCRDHPAGQPHAGSCAGINGWHGPSQSGGSSAGSANTGASGGGSPSGESSSSQASAPQNSASGNSGGPGSGSPPAGASSGGSSDGSASSGGASSPQPSGSQPSGSSGSQSSGSSGSQSSSSTSGATGSSGASSGTNGGGAASSGSSGSQGGNQTLPPCGPPNCNW